MLVPFRNVHYCATALASEPFVTILSNPQPLTITDTERAHANPEITSGFLDFDIELLPDGMCSVDDSPYPLFFANLNHLPPWKQNAWITHDAVNDRYDILQFIQIDVGRRSARD